MKLGSFGCAVGGAGTAIETCRPHRKTQHHDLRRTIKAIIWCCRNGAKWRDLPAELGPWWMAAQCFIRWVRLGVSERLLGLAQHKGVEFGMAFLDGTTIRAHHKAAGAAKKGDPDASAMCVKLLADLAEAMAPRLVSSPTAEAVPSPSR